LHIQLRTWADLLVIAPLSAHTLAKIANGLCDDLLSCIARAWDFGQRDGSFGKPVVLCPAMNTAMWNHVLTRRQLDIVTDFGRLEAIGGVTGRNQTDSIVKVVEPAVKRLACGDVGAGALAELQDIVDCVEDCINLRSSCSVDNVSLVLAL
jgi:phosphopantothenoylcysteine decarboxylase